MKDVSKDGKWIRTQTQGVKLWKGKRRPDPMNRRIPYLSLYSQIDEVSVYKLGRKTKVGVKNGDGSLY